MKILIVSSEVAPFAKTGGLADVAGALPLALARLGADVRVAMPGYGNMTNLPAAPRPVLPHLNIEIGTYKNVASVTMTTLPGSPVPVYFIENAALFHREGLYMENGRDYPDNAERFAIFCKAIIWMIKGLGWIPDVIHCNDWQTGLLPVMLRTDPAIQADPDLSSIHTMFTIHNLAYQGTFPAQTAYDLGFTHTFHPNGVEFYGQLNCLKGGLVYADVLTTVSPTYAKEIQTEEFGAGLDGVLKQRAKSLHGILNGIDYAVWNPATDTHLPAHFTAADLAGKAECKQQLQRELGVKESATTPLLTMISRLDPQKGLSILLPLIDTLMARDVQLAILGTGLAEYHEALQQKATRYKGKMAVRLAFDNGLAHRMEAGGDIFLMPSRYEPCGLNQMYSLRYGTLPVVRRTGGLADSVTPIAADHESGTGFVFDEFKPGPLLSAINEAVALYQLPLDWKQAQKRAMTQDFSWENSARLYADLYGNMISASV